MLRRENESDGDLFKRRAQFVRDGIPRELYVERVAWARQARSAALFQALAALIGGLVRRQRKADASTAKSFSTSASVVHRCGVMRIARPRTDT